MELILLGLWGMKGTDLIKELIPFPVAAWTKSMTALVLVALAGILLGTDMLVIGGSWGAAALFHEIGACFSMISDDKKQQIFLRPTVGRRNIR